MIRVVAALILICDFTIANAQNYPPGRFQIGGYPFSCQGAWTIVTPQLDNLGRSSPGGPIYLRRDLAGYPTAFIAFLFAHECAHHLGEMNETAADQFAVCMGKQQGWLSPQGISQVCQVTLPSPGSWFHLPGPQRCASMLDAYQTC